MSYEERAYSGMSALAMLVAIVALLAVIIVGTYLWHVDGEVTTLYERWSRQHDELVELRTRVDRLDRVLDEAIDSVSLARAILELERQEQEQ